MPDCEGCKESLSGKQFLDQDGKNFCIPCYEDKFAHSCAKCDEKIKVSQSGLAVRDKHYHEDCFVCAECKETLSGKQFLDRDGEKVCMKCSNVDENKECTICSKSFAAGEKKVLSNKKFVHQSCLKCQECKELIGERKYFVIDAGMTCEDCYNKTLRTCKVCDKPVNGGIVYKTDTFHEDCFKCAKCAKELGETDFTSNDDGKLHCMDCFAQHFAEKCKTCDKPVTGKYMKHDAAQYHPDCFKCVKCQKSLCSGTFYKEGGQLLCETCSS